MAALRCDNVFCRKEFELRTDMIKTRVIKADIEKTYFSCPHCGREYTVLFTDSQIRDILERIKNIKQKIKANRGHGDRDIVKHLGQVKRLREEAVRLAGKLREELEEFLY